MTTKLTTSEIDLIAGQNQNYDGSIRYLPFARAIEAAIALPVQPASVRQKALDIRIAQGWKLKGKVCPVLYTDTINGEGVGRDDLWLATTDALEQFSQSRATSDATPLPVQPAPELIERICAANAASDWPTAYGLSAQAARRANALASYLEVIKYLSLPVQSAASNNFTATEQHVELLATLLHFVPTTEPDLIRDLTAFCSDAKSALPVRPSQYGGAELQALILDKLVAKTEPTAQPAAKGSQQ